MHLSDASEGVDGAPSSVMYKDGTPKPVYHALMEKIHGEWETHAALTTGPDGTASLTGVKGDYTVTAGGSTVTFTLDEGMAGPVDIVL